MGKAVKKVLVILGVFFLLFGILAALGTIGMGDMREFLIPEIDMSRIADGEYTGECTISRWAMAVTVTVEDRRVSDIAITDKGMSNITGDLVEKINRQIVGQPEPSFDVLTGASLTSKGYLIAVADALEKRR